MTESAFEGLPAKPPGIAEWEDLLVRVELGPRAMRIVLEGADPPRLTAARDRHGRSAVDHLSHLARREAEMADLLEAMRTGRWPATGSSGPSERGDRDDASQGAERELRRYAERRARNFANAQRRGLEVWEWRAEHPALGTVSAYQLFGYLAAHDGRHLAAIRSLVRQAG
jgi:hypothetical protein